MNIDPLISALVLVIGAGIIWGIVAVFVLLHVYPLQMILFLGAVGIPSILAWWGNRNAKSHQEKIMKLRNND